MKAVISFSSLPLVYIFHWFVFCVNFVYFWICNFFEMDAWRYWGCGLGFNNFIYLGVGGLLLMSIGVLGVYVSRIFIEVKSRPISIVKDLYKNEKSK